MPLIVIDQLKNTKDPEIRENLLHSLKSFLDSLDRAKQVKLIEDSPGLRAVVEKISKSIARKNSNEDYDLSGTKAICEQLLNLIDHSREPPQQHQHQHRNSFSSCPRRDSNHNL